jgi:hypothetical protein
MNQLQSLVASFVTGATLGQGLNNSKTPCTIAAINLTLSGRFTDDCPHCMSPELCDFVVILQDSLSHECRNSPEWKSIIPLLLNTKDQDAEIKSRIQELSTKLLINAGYSSTETADTAKLHDWQFTSVQLCNKLNITGATKIRAFWDSLNPSALVREVLDLRCS